MDPVTASPITTSSRPPKRKFVFFLIPLLLLLIFGAAYFYFQDRAVKDPFKTANLKFTSTAAKDQFDRLISEGLKEKDKDQLAFKIVDAFRVLESDYNTVPHPDKRQSLTLIADYLKKNYPSETSRYSFAVDCKDNKCDSKADYSDSLTALKEQIQNHSKIEQQAKTIIITNIEDAAYGRGAKDSAREYKGLAAVFMNLKNEWLRQSDDSLRSLAEQVLGLMKAADSKRFETETKIGVLKLEK